MGHMGRSTTLAEMRAKFVAREKSVTLITDGGLLAEHEDLVAQLEAALVQERNSLADDGGVRDLAEQVQDLERRIAESRVTLRLRGIGRNQFRRLLDAHESDGEPFNPETFPVALVAACSLDPVMSTGDVESLADFITPGQWDTVFTAAWEACREVDEVPFSVLASVTARA